VVERTIQVESTSIHYPGKWREHSLHDRYPRVGVVGDSVLLGQPFLGLLCSTRCSGQVIVRIDDLACCAMPERESWADFRDNGEGMLGALVARKSAGRYLSSLIDRVHAVTCFVGIPIFLRPRLCSRFPIRPLLTLCHSFHKKSMAKTLGILDTRGMVALSPLRWQRWAKTRRKLEACAIAVLKRKGML
jgi:hypothetical protein